MRALYQPASIPDAGIGSVVHHMGQALALAIETDRVLVVAPDIGYAYTDTDRYSFVMLQLSHASWCTDVVQHEEAV